MATAKKSGSSKSSTKSKSSSSKSSSRKSTARGSTTRKPDTTSVAMKEFEDVRQKRAQFDLPVVDTPGPIAGAGGQVEAVDGCIDVTAEGQTVVLNTHGKATLDGEGIKALQRKLSAAAV